MQEMEQEQNKTEVQEQDQQVLSPDAIYKNNIYALVDDVKDLEQFKGLSDSELKDNKAFFPTLIDYIYINYISGLLGNKRTKQIIYDIDQLDNLFDIYIQLVNKYKWNNKPFIVEYSTFVGISKKTFYQWLNIDDDSNITTSSGSKVSTSYRSDVVQKWIDMCERALLNGSDASTVRDIFILKAKHGYRDNNNVVEVNINHKQVISADELPQLIGLKT